MPVVGYIEQRTDLNKNSVVDFDPKSNSFILFCAKYDFFFKNQNQFYLLLNACHYV